MIWPFGKEKDRLAVEEKELQDDIQRIQVLRSHVVRQWPRVVAVSNTLVTRRRENGFGEELEVSWTPRGMTDDERFGRDR